MSIGLYLIETWKSDRDEIFEFALQLSEMEFISDFKIKIGDQDFENWTLIQELEAQECVTFWSLVYRKTAANGALVDGA